MHRLGRVMRKGAANAKHVVRSKMLAIDLVMLDSTTCVTNSQLDNVFGSMSLYIDIVLAFIRVGGNTRGVPRVPWALLRQLLRLHA